MNAAQQHFQYHQAREEYKVEAPQEQGSMQIIEEPLVKDAFSKVIARLAVVPSSSSTSSSSQRSLSTRSASKRGGAVDENFFRQLVLQDLWQSQDPREIEKGLIRIIKLTTNAPPPQQERRQEDNDSTSTNQEEEQANAKNARLFCQVGGHLVIISLMNRFLHHAGIQVNGCTVLGNLAYYGDFARAPITAVGGMQAVLIAMQQYPDDRILQDYGCNALNNLIQADQAHITQRHSMLLLRDNCEGIRILLHAFRTFCTEGNIVLAVCDLLETTCSWEPVRVAWQQAGATRILESAQDKMPTLWIQLHYAVDGALQRLQGQQQLLEDDEIKSVHSSVQSTTGSVGVNA